MIEIQCAICGNNKNIIELYEENIDKGKISAKTFSARRTPDRMHHRFVKCAKCGLVFSNPILPPNKMLNLYRQSDFTYSDESTYLGQTYVKYTKQYVLPKIYKKYSLLDIGCGNGFFLEEIKKIGLEKVSGIEPGKESVMKAPEWLRKKIKIDILRPGLFRKGSFDIVCCFHTLDHIIEPNGFLQEVNKLLKKGGKAFFIVHNTNGLSVRLLGERSPIFDIEHIYLFEPESLRKIFQKNGFSKTKIFNIKNTYPMHYWVRLMPLPNPIKALLLSIMNFTKLGRLPISISPGNIGIVARK